MSLLVSKQIDMNDLVNGFFNFLDNDGLSKELFFSFVDMAQGIFVTVNNDYQPVRSVVVNITETTAIVTWAEVIGAESYTLEYNIWGDVYSNVKISNITTTSYNLSNLEPSTAYEVRIRPILPPTP